MFYVTYILESSCHREFSSLTKLYGKMHREHLRKVGLKDLKTSLDENKAEKKSTPNQNIVIPTSSMSTSTSLNRKKKSKII